MDEDLSLTDLVDERLDGARVLQRSNPVFIRIDTEDARERARREEGQPRAQGGFSGLVVSVKDNIGVGGPPATLGSPHHDRLPPLPRATVVDRIVAAGAIIIGRTNLHELGLGVTGENEHFGTVHNPHDDRRIAGGSSSGAAVSVATGVCDVALGTDAGGSTRLPAAFCGVVGLKPTLGRLPTSGCAPSSPRTGTVGILAGSVARVRATLDALEDAAPSSARPTVRRDASGQRRRDLRGLRVGVLAEELLGALDAEVADAAARTAAALEDAGALLLPIRPRGFEHATATIRDVMAADAYAAYGMLRDGSRWLTSDRVASRLEAGRRLAPERVLAARGEMVAWREEVDALFGTVDVVMSPTVPILPPTLEEIAASDYSPLTMSRFTHPWSLATTPAVSVPGPGTEGVLPVGIQLVGAPWRDHELLDVAELLVGLDGASG